MSAPTEAGEAGLYPCVSSRALAAPWIQITNKYAGAQHKVDTRHAQNGPLLSQGALLIP